MKKYLLLLMIPLMMLASCAEDTSAYLPQGKEDVDVDSTDKDEENPYEPGENELIPGLFSDTLQVTQNGEIVERRFKYFVPISIDPSKKISIIFEFHGNISFTGELIPDAIGDISKTHILNEIAGRHNCIIVYPAGSASEALEDGSRSLGWQGTDPSVGRNYSKDLPFVEAILKWFGTKTPLYSSSHVFSTGTSSGGIFSFNLAVYRSNIFAAVAPRAAQFKGVDVIPERAVPVRVFLGVDDRTVLHHSAITNLKNFANAIGGYYDGDMVYNENDTLEIPRYKKYLMRSWSGARADYQSISLIDEGHNVSIWDTADLIWEFFESHSMENASTNLFISTKISEVIADGGLPYSIEIKATDGAEITFEAPADWSPVFENMTLKLKAPVNYNTCQNRAGVIKISASLNGNTKTKEVAYKLNPSRTYFEVGDVYYGDKSEPMGVVFWVDPSNLSNAKIICMNMPVHQYGSSLKFGNYGLDLITPDPDDGYANTVKLMEEFENRGRDLKGEPNFSYVWCYELDGTIGWYLPAENELVALSKNVNIVNEKLAAVNGDPILTPEIATETEMTQYLSSTSVLSKEKEAFRPFDFTSMTVLNVIPKKLETTYYNVRAIMKIKK